MRKILDLTRQRIGSAESIETSSCGKRIRKTLKSNRSNVFFVNYGILRIIFLESDILVQNWKMVNVPGRGDFFIARFALGDI